MTEDQAAAWAEARFDETALARLHQFAALVLVENDQQNLIAPSTLGSIWSRHIVDSLQLLALAPAAGHWIDVGTGAGFPGMVIAAASELRVTLIEPRKLRASFLSEAATELGVAHRVEVIAAKSQNACTVVGDVISARAVAPLSALLDATRHLASPKTRYLLPKGRSAAEEVETARRQWHGMFHVERSIVDAASGIVVASGVRRR